MQLCVSGIRFFVQSQFESHPGYKINFWCNKIHLVSNYKWSDIKSSRVWGQFLLEFTTGVHCIAMSLREQMHRRPRVAHDVWSFRRGGAGEQIRRQGRVYGLRCHTNKSNPLTYYGMLEKKSVCINVENKILSRKLWRLSMESALPAENCALRPVETVWGGRGMEIATTERPGLKFRERVICTTYLVHNSI